MRRPPGTPLFPYTTLFRSDRGRLGRDRSRRRRRGGHDLEVELRATDGDADLAAVPQLAEQDLLGERLLHLVLDEARHRARAHGLVEAVLGQPDAALLRQLDRDLLLGELLTELLH